MARREKIIDIQDRDQKLTFVIREMSALKLESWIIRALLLTAGSSLKDGRPDIQSAGAFLAEHGLAALGGLDYDKAQPLLDEMLACCSRVVENVEERCTPQSVEGYIMDVATLITLRMEAIKLNLGFSGPGSDNLSGSPENPSTAGR